MNKKIFVGTISVVLIILAVVIILKLNENNKTFEEFTSHENNIQIDTEYSSKQTREIKNILENNINILKQYNINVEDLSNLQYSYIPEENKYSYILLKDSKFYSIIILEDTGTVEVIE